MSPDEGLDALEETLKSGLPQVAVLPLEAGWQPSGGESIPFLYRELWRSSPDSPRPEGGASSLATILALPGPERADGLVRLIREQIARVMQSSADGLDVEQPLKNLGLDSLMAVEIRNRLQSTIGVSIPLASLLEGPSVAQLARRVADSLLPTAVSTAAAAGPSRLSAQQAAGLLEKLSEFGDTDVDALLAQVLAERAARGEEGS
jgi:aryl carrier-like protein